MTDENFDETRQKLLKHFSNGITHKLILWIISKEPIHGYGIMKKLEEFFNFENPARYIRFYQKWKKRV